MVHNNTGVINAFRLRIGHFVSDGFGRICHFCKCGHAMLDEGGFQ